MEWPPRQCSFFACKAVRSQIASLVKKLFSIFVEVRELSILRARSPSVSEKAGVWIHDWHYFYLGYQERDNSTHSLERLFFPSFFEKNNETRNLGVDGRSRTVDGASLLWKVLDEPASGIPKLSTSVRSIPYPTTATSQYPFRNLCWIIRFIIHSLHCQSVDQNHYIP